MNATFQDVKQAALGLPAAERVELVDAIIASLPANAPSTLDESWLAELDRRCEEIDSGKVQGVPWEEVKQRARRRAQSHG